MLFKNKKIKFFRFTKKKKKKKKRTKQMEFLLFYYAFLYISERAFVISISNLYFINPVPERRPVAIVYTK